MFLRSVVYLEAESCAKDTNEAVVRVKGFSDMPCQLLPRHVHV